MSARTATRSMLNRPRWTVARPRTTLRYESTTQKASEAASQAGSKAKQAASNVQSKASEGLTRVKSSGGEAISGATESVGNAVNRVGGPIGRLIRAVESAIPPTIYYSKVALELSKMVFQGQKMSPPSISTFQAYFSPLINAFRNPSSLSHAASSIASTSPESILSRIRSIDRRQLAVGGVVAAEVLGFFTVGEMIGRMKLVGYRGDVHHGH